MASAPHRPDARPSGPVSIGRIVSRLMARTGYDRELAADGLATAWQAAAPPALQGASRAGLVRRGVLEVFVSHSALVQELGFQKREVLARLAELAPAAGITDIRCRLMADAGPTA
ncbi:MAG: DUF721 domain-containing protein [Planctomycetia bacterium]